VLLRGGGGSRVASIDLNTGRVDSLVIDCGDWT
jgi:hypothetical protein